MILVENNFFMNGGDFDVAAVNDIYEVRGVFSLDANRNLSATFWLVENGELVTSSLGSCEYSIFDKNGDAVVLLTESGLAPDVNGQYISTPVSGITLNDLTHYVALVSIDYKAETRQSYLGIIIGD